MIRGLVLARRRHPGTAAEPVGAVRAVPGAGGALRRLAKLAAGCRAVIGSDALDIEWAWVRRRPWLLRCRPVITAG